MDLIKNNLKEFIEDYEKGDNVTTKMDELVDYLKGLRDKK